MKPWKFAIPLANWLLRLSLAAYLIIFYWGVLTGFHLGTLTFWVSAIYILFAVLLLFGGLASDQSLTVVSALVIFLLSLLMVFLNLDGTFKYDIFPYLFSAVVGFYFVTRGNRS